MGELLVGCSGWAHRDWVNNLYPPDLPATQWLTEYAKLFPVVETDASFHALPPRATVDAWIRQAETHPRLRFCAVAPQQLTHAALPKGDTREIEQLAQAFLEGVVHPLEDARRLCAVLLQLSPDFELFHKEGELDALTALLRTVESLGPDERRVAVELRHGSWFEHVGERVAPEVVEPLAGLHAGIAQTDGLGRRFTSTRTVPWTYVRLHGRRTQIPASERHLTHAAYHYSYAPSEIQEIADHVGRLRRDDELTLVVFNNYHRAQSAHNAMDLIEALGQPRPRPAVPAKREATLDEF